MNKLEFCYKLSKRKTDILERLSDGMPAEVYTILDDALEQFIDIEVELSDSEDCDDHVCSFLEVIGKTARETIEKLSQYTANPIALWNSTYMYPITEDDMSITIGNFRSTF